MLKELDLQFEEQKQSFIPPHGQGFALGKRVEVLCPIFRVVLYLSTCIEKMVNNPLRHLSCVYWQRALSHASPRKLDYKQNYLKTVYISLFHTDKQLKEFKGYC